MANSLEAIDIVYSHLKEILNDAKKPTGGVFKSTRPLNSVKEDIVINVLTLNRENGIQEGVLNVNIHVPNLSLTIGGVTDNTQPNHPRILYLTKAVENLLTEVYGDNYNFSIDGDNLFEEEKSSYNNIRLSFNNLNY